MKKAILALAFGAACATAAAASPPVAAWIDGKPLYALTVQALARDMPVEPGRSALDSVIAERLTAAEVRLRHAAAQLHPAASVGFARDVAREDRLVAILRAHMVQELAALPAGAPDAMVIAEPPVASEVWDTLAGTPGRLQLEYTLTPAQAALAERTPLLRYRLFDGPAATISIQDVLRRQNVQGRMEFFNRNADHMRRAARARLASLYVLERAARSLGHAVVADLRQALSDQDDVRAALALYGLASGAEADSPVQAAIARDVSAADIAAFYTSNRHRFKRVDRVKARHIVVAGEVEARAIAAAAAEPGASFEALARRHSTAPDAAQGGRLGWIRQSADPDWRASLALMQPAGKPAGPFRTPVGPSEQASWEILLVEERIEGYHPRDSETVRYEARKAIAAARARHRFAALRDAAVRVATIERALPDAGGRP